jgi:hypothetical protein
MVIIEFISKSVIFIIWNSLKYLPVQSVFTFLNMQVMKFILIYLSTNSVICDILSVGYCEIYIDLVGLFFTLIWLLYEMYVCKNIMLHHINLYNCQVSIKIQEIFLRIISVIGCESPG